MKLQFLGSGSAFTPLAENYQSNMIIKSANGKNLLIDCGSDARHSLQVLGFTPQDIDGVYISHLHADHAGGLEWLAFSTKFIKNPKKPKLYVHPLLITRLWENVLSGGLQTLEGEKPAELSDFYEIMPITNECFSWEDIHFKLVKTIHTCNGNTVSPSYGIFFTTNNSKIFISTDTQFEPKQYEHYFKQADLIFHDCDTSAFKSPVHAHFTELATLPPEIKAKMWLYHYPAQAPQQYNPLEEGFLGYVLKGQEFAI